MLKTLLLIVATTLLLSVATNSLQQQDDEENGSAEEDYIEEQSADLTPPLVKNAVVPQRKRKTEGDSGEETESSQEQNERYVEAGLAVANVIAALIGIASGPVGGIAAAGIAIVGHFLTKLAEKKTTLWQQIETKVDLKIGEKLVEYHFELLKTDVFRVLEDRFKKDSFTHHDMRVVLDKRHKVFPYNFPSLAWSPQLPLALLYYLPFLITGYQQLAAKGEVDNCVLPNEMARFRADVITSMKEMMRKRYDQLKGTKLVEERADCKKRRKTLMNKSTKNKTRTAEVRRLGPPIHGRACVSIDRIMTWDDGLSGESFTIRKRFDGFVGNDFNAEVNKIKKKTEDLLWKEVVEKVNKYFDPKICFSSFGCKCPEKIKRSEIDFPFPRSCWDSGVDGECMHPCDFFQSAYSWCWLKTRNDQYSECVKPDLGSCMPVEVAEIKYPNVFPAEKAKNQPKESDS